MAFLEQAARETLSRIELAAVEDPSAEADYDDTAAWCAFESLFSSSVQRYLPGLVSGPTSKRLNERDDGCGMIIVSEREIGNDVEMQYEYLGTKNAGNRDNWPGRCVR